MGADANAGSSKDAPLVFLSHASKDNERFVVGLDQALRARGIRVWFDKREIRLGDNLVDRIFDQGIGRAGYVILVLSNNTDESAFVQKELTTTVVSRITSRIKAVFPILLDGIEPPVAIRDTAYLSADISSIEMAADKIRDAIFGVEPAPVAAQPAYAGLPVHRLGDLTPDDERVLAVIADLHVDAPRWHPSVGTEELLERTRALDLSDAVVLESLEVLEHNGFLEQQWELGNAAPYAVNPSSFALAIFLPSYRPREYRRARRAIVADAVNGQHSLDVILEARGIGEPLAIAILDELQGAGQLAYSMYSEGTFITPTPMLRRFLRKLEDEDVAGE